MEQEIKMLMERQGSNPLEQVQPVVSLDQLAAMQDQVGDVYIQDAIYHYIVRLVDATRHHKHIQLGLSPRGTLALVSMAKAAAYVRGRAYIVPEYVEDVFLDVAAHRIVLKQKAKLGHVDEREVLQEILDTQAKPAVKREERA